MKLLIGGNNSKGESKLSQSERVCSEIWPLNRSSAQEMKPFHEVQYKK